MTSWIDPSIYRYLKDQFRISWNGYHGGSHWARVKINGNILCDMHERRGHDVSRNVVDLFSILHDHQRVDEGQDFGHGQRAANELVSLRGKFFELPDAEFSALYRACVGHSDGGVHEELSVQICWDADRLDLARVGVIPNARYLCTQYAKRQDVIDAAIARSLKSMS
jgi:uncharacterized protein